MRVVRSDLPATSVTAFALLVAAVGFVVCMLAGVTDTPTIPPGLVAIIVSAGLVVFVPGQWVPIAGTAAALFNLVAFFLVGADDRLFQVSPVVGFIGTWVMVAALVVAGIAGTIAAVQRDSP